jgi:hypothetical protein
MGEKRSRVSMERRSIRPLVKVLFARERKG